MTPNKTTCGIMRQYMSLKILRKSIEENDEASGRCSMVSSVAQSAKSRSEGHARPLITGECRELA